MTIKHLVISGGAYYGFCIYGALKQLSHMNKFDIKNVQTIYATSVGTMIGCMVALDYDWNTLDDYLIKRPWHQTFPVNLNSIFSAYSNCGVFNYKFIDSVMHPILLGKNLDPDITLREFYDVTGIQMGFVTTRAEDISCKTLTHLSHPDLRLTNAIYYSCCLPILFKPATYKGDIYIDGGVTNNFPIDISIANGAEKDEILGVQLRPLSTPKIQTDSLLDFLFSLLNVIIKSVIMVKPTNTIDNHIIIEKPSLSLTSLYETINHQSVREELVSNGVDTVNMFYSSENSSGSSSGSDENV